jgi:ferritin
MDERMSAALQDQVNAELYSGYLYLSMAAYFDAGSLPGAAHWMRKQAAEELEHGLKIMDHLLDRGEQVRLLAIQSPDADFASPLAVFEQAYAHERVVTGRIADLVRLAAGVEDFAAGSMLRWFVDEQVEEEKSAALIVDQLRMAGNSGAALLMLDRTLAQRE